MYPSFPDRRRAFLKSFFTATGMLIATALMADVAGYFFLPSRIARKLSGYKIAPRRTDEAIGGNGRYPQKYFTSHPTRGFDIRPNARGTHSVEDIVYPVWSNHFGCFDQDWPVVPSGYFYFAGDSTTWGYTPFEQKFATLFQERTGIPSFKCGVTHTGQRHQFEKFQSIAQMVGAFPSQVIVGWDTNDVENDYLHPHSTVVDGWLVDDVFMDAKTYRPVRVDRSWIEARIAETLSRQRAREAEASLWATAKGTLRRYSVSVQLLTSAVGAIRAALGLDSRERSSAARDIFYRGQPLKKMYALGPLQVENARLKYAESEFTAANRQALLAWARDAEVRRYQLTFLLIPYREIHENANFFDELKDFMRANGLHYIDLGEELRAMRATADDVYWQTDGHMSPNGNRLVADILVRHFAKESAAGRR